MKALLFVLVRAFEFELAVPIEKIGVKIAIVRQPTTADEEDPHQMPLIVKPYKRD